MCVLERSKTVVSDDTSKHFKFFESIIESLHYAFSVLYFLHHLLFLPSLRVCLFLILLFNFSMNRFYYATHSESLHVFIVASHLPPHLSTSLPPYHSSPSPPLNLPPSPPLNLPPFYHSSHSLPPILNLSPHLPFSLPTTHLPSLSASHTSLVLTLKPLCAVAYRSSAPCTRIS